MKAKRILLYTIALTVSTLGCGSPNRRLTERNQSNEATLSSAQFVPAGYRKVWDDQFNDTLINTNNWSVGTLRAPNGDVVPGATGDHLLNQNYTGYITAEDSYIQNGSLVLRNQKRSYTGTSPSGTFSYTSGWVMSMHQVFFNKGYVEVKAKFPSGDKVWPALWLIAEDLVWAPEWDMFEYFGYRKDVGYDNMGTHLAYGEWPAVEWRTNWLRKYDANFDCESWHTYGFEWTSTAAIWHIDGTEVYRLDNRGTLQQNWPNENMYIVLNNGVRTESPDIATVWPNYLIIDYIEVYKKP